MILNLVPPQYRVAIKFGLFFCWSVFMVGVGSHFQKEHDTVIAQDLEIKNSNTIIDTVERLNQKNIEYTGLAGRIELVNNEKQNEIDGLERANRKLFTDGRVLRKLCTSVDKSDTKDSNPGSIKNETSITATLSESFQRFLNFQFRRADELGVYAETAYQWIRELDKDGDGFICD